MALQARLDAFEELLKLSRQRVDDAVLAEATGLLDRLGERGRLSMDHTVVAFAGATGSGKSSLFNAVSGLDLSGVGVRRPTTSTAVACVWDPEGAQALLDRLNVSPRQRFMGRSVLDTGWLAIERELAGLVLLDLPDHDSIDTRHRAQCERLIELVDVVVWVLDPEKYADASVHERYLRPFASHSDVMLVVLNQIDRLPNDGVPPCMAHLRRLLDDDGLAVSEHGDAGVQVLATSTLTGEGVDELRSVLEQVVGQRRSATQRMCADLDRAAAELASTVYAEPGWSGLDSAARARFLVALGEAVGAPAVREMAEAGFVLQVAHKCAPAYVPLLKKAPWRAGPEHDDRAHSAYEPAGPAGLVLADQRSGRLPRRGRFLARGAGTSGASATGASGGALVAGVPIGPGGTDESIASPVTRQTPRPRGHGADQATSRKAPGAAGAMEGTESGEPDETAPILTAPAVAAQQPMVQAAVRGVARDVTEGLPDSWARAVRRAANDGGQALASDLDSALSNVDTRIRALPWWSSVAAAVQWLLLTLAIVGAAGLIPWTAQLRSWPWWFAGGWACAALLGGWVLAAVCRAAARPPARRHGLDLESRLRRAVEERGACRVLGPVDAELRRYRAVRDRFHVVAGDRVPLSSDRVIHNR